VVVIFSKHTQKHIYIFVGVHELWETLDFNFRYVLNHERVLQEFFVAQERLLCGKPRQPIVIGGRQRWFKIFLFFVSFF
jgi:hypothetical protein